MKAEEISLDEMWNTIERFGIKREMLENSNPDPKTIKELYLAITKRRE
jgi:hypothetical protein